MNSRDGKKAKEAMDHLAELKKASANWGGKRPGAGRKPTKPTMSIELTEQASHDLRQLIDDLNLDPKEARVIVSTLVSEALREQSDRWRDIFGNTLASRAQDPST